MKRLLFILFMCLSAIVYGADQPVVTVSIPVQKYIIDEITGGKVKVNVLLPAGSDPHTFSPKAEQAKQLANSKVYFAIGFSFEKTKLPAITGSNKDLKIVHTNDGIKTIQEWHDHADEAGHDDHDGEEIDPHVWTSPKNMLIVAISMYKKLVLLDSANEPLYKANYEKFISKVQAYDDKFTKLFADDNISKLFLVYHPSWGYFATDYGLTQLAIEDKGKDPKAVQIKEIITISKTKKVNSMILQPNQTTKAAMIVANELGIKPAYIDSMMGDWSAMMDKLYATFDKR